MSYKSEIIHNYLGSSELNRMRKNGIRISVQHEFDLWELLKTGTIDSKLKRKLKTLWGIGVLNMPKKPVIGVITDVFFESLGVGFGSLEGDIARHIAKAFLDAEDYYILHGKLPNE